MVTRTFQAESTIQTLQLVQAELGAEAIVVSMREIPVGPVWNPWKKSAVEVVATMPEHVRPYAVSHSSKMVNNVEERPEIEWEIPATRKPIKLSPPSKLDLTPMPNPPTPLADSVRKTESASPSTDRHTPPSLKKIQQQLLQQGVEIFLVERLISLALETLGPATLADTEACKQSIIQLMGAELRVQKGAGVFVSNHIMCVVGASGSGKTSMIAKLAMFFRQNLNKSVSWVCADTVRMGAIAEAKSYTDALGMDLKLVYTPQDLKEIVRAPQANDLFLVDTPGINPCNERQMVELGAMLAEMPGRCTYLVAPATAKEADLFQLYASLGVFNLDGLIVTKLDETHNFGGLYNFVRKNQIPLGYYASGRETTHPLEAADPARLVSALFGKEWNN